MFPHPAQFAAHHPTYSLLGFRNNPKFPPAPLHIRGAVFSCILQGEISRLVPYSILLRFSSFLLPARVGCDSPAQIRPKYTCPKRFVRILSSKRAHSLCPFIRILSYKTVKCDLNIRFLSDLYVFYR